jgi:hypothetical protein
MNDKIHCFRKNGSVLIPNWNQELPPSELEFEVKLLRATGWEKDTLTPEEVSILHQNTL